MCSRQSKQRWSRIVWFNQGIPRFVFIMWLAVKGRLPTGVRTRCWGLIHSCLLCGEPDETRDHLFFACPYAFTVWTEVIGDLLNEPPNLDWLETMACITSQRFDMDCYLLIWLALQTTIYHTWRERNERKHKENCHPTTHIACIIDKTIWNRITSLRPAAHSRYEQLMHWFRSRGV